MHELCWISKEYYATLAWVRLEDLGLIGNCQFSALIERTGAVVWCCLPRFDSEPIFATLARRDATAVSFASRPADGSLARSAISRTPTCSRRASRAPTAAFRVLDFAPRFVQYERMFRPTSSCASSSRSRARRGCSVTCEPRAGLVEGEPRARSGLATTSRYRGLSSPLRLTTDVPLSYLDGDAFALTERKHLVLTWGAPDRGAAAGRCAIASCSETVRYWQRWVKHCNIPPLYQQRGDSLGARAQAALLRGHRRDRRRDDDVDPRVAGQRPHLGLPLLLAARRVLRARRVPAARPLRGAREFVSYLLEHRRRRARSRRSRRSTASTARAISKSASRRTGPASTATARCASATARRCTSSTTSSARWCSRSRPSSSTSASATSERRATLDLLERLARQGDRRRGHARRRHLGVPHGVGAADVLEP